MEVRRSLQAPKRSQGQLVCTRDGAIASVDHFMLSEVYTLFGVPNELGPLAHAAEPPMSADSVASRRARSPL